MSFCLEFKITFLNYILIEAHWCIGDLYTNPRCAIASKSLVLSIADIFSCQSFLCGSSSSSLVVERMYCLSKFMATTRGKAACNSSRKRDTSCSVKVVRGYLFKYLITF